MQRVWSDRHCAFLPAPSRLVPVQVGMWDGYIFVDFIRDGTSEAARHLTANEARHLASILVDMALKLERDGEAESVFVQREVN
ncbi:MAG: hypothetical protein MSG64_17580 [Pyrinomonadaceae bacterium MAG19_C2-C3]|nr:hypothetical protein [Pyrinomonadaceae bacterium MAG19_C2-C3]